jgi:hypothetical protein
MAIGIVFRSATIIPAIRGGSLKASTYFNYLARRAGQAGGFFYSVL